MMTLKDRIFIENQHIKISNEIDNKIKEHFKKYVDTKILISDGTLLKKIKENPELKTIIDIKNYNPTPLNEGHVSLNLYVHNSYGNSLQVNVKLCFNGGKYEDKTYYCIYIEHPVYIGKLKDSILTELEPSLQKDLIDFKQQEKQINLFKEKSKELQTIKNSINYNLNEFIK